MYKKTFFKIHITDEHELAKSIKRKGKIQFLKSITATLSPIPLATHVVFVKNVCRTKHSKNCDV